MDARTDSGDRTRGLGALGDGDRRVLTMDRGVVIAVDHSWPTAPERAG